MLITLSGIHGLGKTTFVNNFLTEKPLFKIVDIDLVPERKEKEEEQLERLKYFHKVLKKVKDCKIDVLIDRSPIDFHVYIDWWLGNIKEYPKLNKKLKKVINDYKKINYKNIIVYEDLNIVWERVLKRARNKYDEANFKYFKYCYNKFYNQKGENFKKLTGIESDFIHLNKLPKEVKKFLNKS